MSSIVYRLYLVCKLYFVNWNAGIIAGTRIQYVKQVEAMA